MFLTIIVFVIVVYMLFALMGYVTSQQTDRPYQEIGRSAHFMLEADGLIIGFEKRSIKGKERKKILGVLSNQHLYANLVEPLPDKEEINKKKNKLFQKYTRFNTKVMIPTQVLSMTDGDQKFIYNAYERHLDGVYDYVTAYEKLSNMFEKLRDDDAFAGKYTHIIVMNMGWNNDQTESMWRYNRIISNLNARATEDSIKFKPFLVAITWPSVWRSINDFPLSKKLFHLLSYPNKTLDADELGITWMNWLVNSQLPSLINKEQTNAPKLVLIGHSLGARILSRAVFSAEHLLESKDSNEVDLLIGLQPAFSARRFVVGSGIEGYPYSDYANKKTRFVFTTSVHDRANPIANYITGAKHIGGSRGLAYARKIVAKNESEGRPTVFTIKDWSETLEDTSIYDSNVLLLDASSIVVGSDEPKLSAHNDILDHDMSRLIWRYIKGL